MRTENLAIVFVDIAGFTPRTSAQTREQNLLMLRRFDEIVRPLVRVYNGRVVKTIGDAYLLTFRSPTDGLLCSTAIQDRIAETDAQVDPADRFRVRAAVNVGEVRIDGGDVFGEAVNIAARIEGKAAAGEIYFSESAFLSMTRSEVPWEEVGYAELKGIADKVRMYRIPRADETGGYAGKITAAEASAAGLPFGGIGLNRVRTRLAAVNPADLLVPAKEHAQNLLVAGSGAALRGYAWWKTEVQRNRAVQVATIVVLIAVVWFMVWALRPKPTAWQKLHRSLGF